MAAWLGFSWRWGAVRGVFGVGRMALGVRSLPAVWRLGGVVGTGVLVLVRSELVGTGVGGRGMWGRLGPVYMAS